MNGEGMKKSLPELSRLEMISLRKLWSLGDATARELLEQLPGDHGYSTVRKILERLEEKGAVEKIRLEGKAWVYRSTVSASAMIRKEIRRLLDTFFDGSAAPLVAHLADMDAVSLDDIRELEKNLDRAEDGDETPGAGEGKTGRGKR
jgi:BlaI family penicillinase repressor